MVPRNCNKSFPFLVTLLTLCSATPAWYRAIDGQQYLIESDKTFNWLQAYDECARRGLQLVDINNSAKNTNLVSILRTHFGSLSLWIGSHDEFNKSVDTNRPFYSVATGEEIKFSSWYNGEPNSKNNAIEHCIEMYGGPKGYNWNDKNCEVESVGYICEENIYTSKYRNDMNQKRRTAYQKNNNLSTEFAVTQKELDTLGQNTRLETENVLNEFQRSSSAVLDGLKKSLDEISLQKQHLEVLMNNFINSFNNLISENKAKFVNISQGVRQNINDIHVRAESATTRATSKHSERLKANTNEINGLLVF